MAKLFAGVMLVCLVACASGNLCCEASAYVYKGTAIDGPFCSWTPVATEKCPDEGEQYDYMYESRPGEYVIVHTGYACTMSQGSVLRCADDGEQQMENYKADDYFGFAVDADTKNYCDSCPAPPPPPPLSRICEAYCARGGRQLLFSNLPEHDLEVRNAYSGRFVRDGAISDRRFRDCQCP